MLRVERLTKEDAAEIEDLLREVWPKATEYPEKWREVRALTRNQIMNEMNSGFNYFGVRLEGKIVGLYKTRITKDVCDGEHQSVHPAFREHGLAKAMYKHFTKFAKRAGYRKVRVNILPSQVASVKLMNEFGFRKVRAYEQVPGMLVHTYEKELRVARGRHG